MAEQPQMVAERGDLLSVRTSAALGWACLAVIMISGCAPSGANVAESTEHELTFVGRVVDREGRPIKGVEVVMAASSAKALSGDSIGLVDTNIRMVTDSEGLFELGGQNGERAHGIRATVESVRKAGYEFMRSESGKMGYDAMYNTPPTRETPRRLVMRKLGESLSDHPKSGHS